MLTLVSFDSFVNFLAVDCISILNNADFFGIDFTDNSDSKSGTREWLAEYKTLRNAKFKTGFADFILEKVTKRFNNFLEIHEITKPTAIVERFYYC